MNKKFKFIQHGFPALFIGIMIFGFSNVCYANSYNFTSGMPWDALMTTLGNELTGPIPKTMATVAMVLSGMMLMFGETGGMYKRSLQLVFGVAIAVNAGDLVTLIMSDITPDSSSIVPPAVKPMTSPDFISSFMATLKGTCMQGAYKIVPIALGLLGMLAVIEIAMGVSFNFEQDHIKYIFKETLKIGMFAFLIIQWVGGTYGIATVIGQGFEVFGLTASGSTMVNPDEIVANGLGLITHMWEATMGLGWGSIGLIIANILVMCGVILSVFFMVIEIFICKVEFTIISVLTIPLIPFGILKHTRFLFEKATGAIFSMGIKLMVLSFVSAISAPVLFTMAQSVKTAGATKEASSLSVILSMLLGCLVLYTLVKKAPEMAQGLLSGSPSLSGGNMTQAATGAVSGVVGGAVGVAAGVMGAAGVAQMAATMAGGRNTNGNVNFGGAAKNLGKMAMAKAKSPYHEGMSGQKHRLSQQTQNHEAIKDSKSGNPGKGEALKRQISRDTNSGD